MASERGPPEDLAESWASAGAEQSTRDRIYAVAVQLHEPTRVAAVAERADCAKETARDHLRWLVEAGIVEQNTENPDTFSRNKSYFRWRRTNRLRQELSSEQLRERLSELTEQERRFKERYDAENPTAVNALDHTEYDDVERVWMELGEWETLRRRIRDLERVRVDRTDGAYA
jgi:predicted ArsR family transcriptional regulator